MNAVPGTVLLVEDDSNDVLLMQRAFRRARVVNPVQVAEDGEDAILYLSGQGPYVDRTRFPLPILVVLDLKLPRKTGLEVLEWLRQQPGLRRLPVVILTSSKESTDISRAYDLGVNSYLVKPVSFDTLLEMIETLNVYWLVFNEKPTVERT